MSVIEVVVTTLNNDNFISYFTMWISVFFNSIYEVPV